MEVHIMFQMIQKIFVIQVKIVLVKHNILIRLEVQKNVFQNVLMINISQIKINKKNVMNMINVIKNNRNYMYQTLMKTYVLNANNMYILFKIMIEFVKLHKLIALIHYIHSILLILMNVQIYVTQQLLNSQNMKIFRFVYQILLIVQRLIIQITQINIIS